MNARQKKRAQQQQQTQQPRVTIGRTQKSPPLQSPQAKLKVQVEQGEQKRAERARIRELEAENARLEAFRDLDRQCDKILTERIELLHLTPEEARRQTHVLNGAIERHRAKGLDARAFDPYKPLNRDAERHGRAVRTGSGETPIASALPPPRSEATARKGLAPVPGDQAAQEARMREAQERGARLREQDRSDREAYQAALRRHGLTDPSVGSVPGDPRGYFG